MDPRLKAWLYKGTMETEAQTLLSAVAVQGAGAAKDVSGLKHLNAQISGLITATVKVEGSLDGTNFSDVSGNKTADGNFVLTVPGALKQVKGNVSAYTSGAITLIIAGNRI